MRLWPLWQYNADPNECAKVDKTGIFFKYFFNYLPEEFVWVVVISFYYILALLLLLSLWKDEPFPFEHFETNNNVVPLIFIITAICNCGGSCTPQWATPISVRLKGSEWPLETYFNTTIWNVVTDHWDECIAADAAKKILQTPMERIHLHFVLLTRMRPMRFMWNLSEKRGE